jgi:hypothetical protein
MIDIGFEAHETKRRSKIALVKSEWGRIAGADAVDVNRPGSPSAIAAARLKEEADARSSAALEAEMKRLANLKRRQEDEIAKMVEKETQAVLLQKKIVKAEEEDFKRKKEHEKKVIAAKAAAAKKITQRLKERALKEEDEARRKREIQKKEKEFEAKMAAVKAEEEKAIAAKAAAADRERAEKVAAKKKKTEAAIEAQFALAETTRKTMMEREQRVQNAIIEKKKQKALEVQEARDAAKERIACAMEKFHALHEAQKAAFQKKGLAATIRAKEKAIEEREALKKQADDRERKLKVRQTRLEDAFKTRSQNRASIVARRTEKDKTFGIISKERDKLNAVKKFNQDLKLQDKRENVERIARVNEFKRLQTLRKIEAEDLKMLKLKAAKNALLTKHRDEGKLSLTRKHAIADAMDVMRMTNDFSKLDQLFKKKPEKKEKGDDDEDVKA